MDLQIQDYPKWILESMGVNDIELSIKENKIDLRYILKDNWSVINSQGWINLIDTKKIIEISFCDLCDIIKKSDLSYDEQLKIKERRKKAQRSRSSLKCHTNKRKDDAHQENLLIKLGHERNELFQMKQTLENEIEMYKQSLVPTHSWR